MQKRVLGMIEKGRKEGAKLEFGGDTPAKLKKGAYVNPTLFTGVKNGMTIAQQEIFGPVASVIEFNGVDEAIKIANDTIYGLAGSIWTENLGRAVRVSRAVQSGVLSVNSHSSVRYWTPFGGMKASGLGRELGPDAAEHFTQTKNVFFATDA